MNQKKAEKFKEKFIAQANKIAALKSRKNHIESEMWEHLAEMILYSFLHPEEEYKEELTDYYVNGLHDVYFQELNYKMKFEDVENLLAEIDKEEEKFHNLITELHNVQIKDERFRHLYEK